MSSTKGRAVIGSLIIILLGLLLIMVAACTTEADVAEAKRRQALAESYLAEAQAQGTVNVLEAQTDAYLEKTRQEADITKEMRQFDAAMARQEFSTAMLELQALQIALRETQTVVEPIGHNAEAAAKNSWLNGIFIIGLAISIAGLCGLVIFLGAKSEQRLGDLERALKSHGQNAAAQREDL